MIRAATVLMCSFMLTGCISAQSWEATRVLQDIEAGPGPSALKDRTPAPKRTTLAVETDQGSIPVDLYHPRQTVGARMVLLPGFTRQGKDDPRLVQLAKTLARARFLVMVPDLEGARTLTVRREDVSVIADVAARLASLEVEQAADDQPVGISAISYAVGLAILASTQAPGDEAIDFVVSVGGYYDVENVVTFATTGAFRRPGDERWQELEPEPMAKWIFLRSNVDVLEGEEDRELLARISERRMADPQAPIDELARNLGEGGQSLLDLITNKDPERVPELLDRLPKAAQRDIEALSLVEQDLSHLSGNAILIHGRADTMIPYSESERLARAIADTDLHLISGFSHIDPGDTGLSGQWQLIGAVMDVLDRREP